ncbi:MAG TPA: DUF4336 domain-containing protein [Abditibacteriaceae bacterium]|jgi:hypothetical protein
MESASLRELHSNSLWVAETPFRLLGLEVGARMTVVRLSDSPLLVISPIDLTPQLRAELDALGAVRCIIAPNRFHFLSVSEYSKAFPNAALFIAPGVKVADAPVSGTLNEHAEALWSDVLDQAIFYGNKMEQEVVFFHRNSRTLILTDLCFNVRRATAPIQRVAARLLDINGKFGPSRLFRITTRDKTTARASRERILRWDFDRVVMAHGEVLESGGKAAMKRALRWL